MIENLSGSSKAKKASSLISPLRSVRAQTGSKVHRFSDELLKASGHKANKLSDTEETEDTGTADVAAASSNLSVSGNAGDDVPKNDDKTEKLAMAGRHDQSSNNEAQAVSVAVNGGGQVNSYSTSLAEVSSEDESLSNSISVGSDDDHESESQNTSGDDGALDPIGNLLSALAYMTVPQPPLNSDTLQQSVNQGEFGEQAGLIGQSIGNQTTGNAGANNALSGASTQVLSVSSTLTSSPFAGGLQSLQQNAGTGEMPVSQFETPSNNASNNALAVSSQNDTQATLHASTASAAAVIGLDRLVVTSVSVATGGAQPIASFGEDGINLNEYFAGIDSSYPGQSSSQTAGQAVSDLEDAPDQMALSAQDAPMAQKINGKQTGADTSSGATPLVGNGPTISSALSTGAGQESNSGDHPSDHKSSSASGKDGADDGAKSVVGQAVSGGSDFNSQLIQALAGNEGHRDSINVGKSAESQTSKEVSSHSNEDSTPISALSLSAGDGQEAGSTVSMTLKTPDSSEVKVHVTNDSEGLSSIVLQADNEATSHELKKNHEDLIRALDAAGIDTSNVKIEVLASEKSNTDQQGSGQSDQTGQQNWAGDSSGNSRGNQGDPDPKNMSSNQDGRYSILAEGNADAIESNAQSPSPKVSSTRNGLNITA